MTELAQVGCELVLPAGLAWLLGWLTIKCLPQPLSKRYAAAIPFAVAFFVGGGFVLEWELIPERAWYWLPYLTLAGAILGPLAFAEGASRGERWLAFLLVAVVFAWLVTPTWDSLQPPRPVWIGVLTATTTLLAGLLAPLARRTASRSMFTTALAVTMLAIAALSGALVNLSYGRLAGVAAAALFGVTLTRHAEDSDRRSLAALTLSYSIAALGLAFTAGVYPKEPLWPLFAIPVAPLALWLATIGRPVPATGFKAHAVQTLVLLVVLGIIVAFCLPYALPD